MPIKKKPIYVLTFLLFCSLCLIGLLYQGIIFYRLGYEYSSRSYQHFLIGLCHQIQVAAVFSLFSLLVCYFSLRVQKFFLTFVVLLYIFIFYIDYRYILQFNSHFPFSVLSYIAEKEVYQSFLAEFLQLDFLFFFVFPSVIFCTFLYFLFWQTKATLGKSFLNFFWLLCLGVVSGSYANSYLGKSKIDPLSTQVFLYFHKSREIFVDEIKQKPSQQLTKIQNYLNQDKKVLFDEKFPLTNQSDSSCNEFYQNDLSDIFCSLEKPNILFVILESFRASDIGVYGGKLPITPRFDEFAKEGILFQNFFANGYQTKHGEVASLCSVMPSYGLALLDKYHQNGYLCLSQVLKQQGYYTSFIHNGDLAFDNQYSFFKKNNFQKIIDKFDYAQDTEVLGWGYSDEALFQKWATELKQFKEPFFSVGLSLSTHHPYEIPDKFHKMLAPLQLANNQEHRFFKSIFYTDYQLGQFIDTIRQEEWYKNSIIFLFADTSSYLQAKHNTGILEKIRIQSHIPLLILGGKIPQAKQVAFYASQIDLAPTIIDFLKINISTPWVGKSLLTNRDFLAFTNRPSHHWSIFSEAGSFALLDSKQVILEKLALKKKNEYTSLAESWILVQKWLLQNNRVWQSD